jgi:hypothetical protein
MTIILQHEFWDLSVNGEGFEVSLSFSRKPERLTIPFAAITGFSDPSVPTFGFKFMVPEGAESGSASPAASPLLTAKTRGEAEPPAKRVQGPASATKAPPPSGKPPEPTNPPATPKAPEKTEAAKVVSIDAFRKK